MYSNFTDKSVIERGKKKVYSVVDKLELTLPDGKSDGFLEVGDLVYVSQKYKVGDKSAFRFRVMKFADSEKESKVYSAEKIHFKPYYEKKSNADAEEVDSASADAPVNPNIKGIVTDLNSPNYIVPTITTLSGGLFGYMLAQKYGKSVVKYGIVGLAIGLAIGVFIIKSKEKSK